jgi:hypothetical protein
MIYDGINGYVKGSLDLPSDSELAMTKGPIKGRNWMYTATNPTYSITITAGATGTVKLQGTNDVAIREDSNSNNPVATDLLPSTGASWSDIQAATNTSVSGSFATEYQFLRLVVGTQGTGTVTQAWVRWT